jgi:hypothetical protein
MTVDLDHRMNNGLQFRANYTWSKNLDLGSGVGGSQTLNSAMTIMNPYDLRRDWGLSPLDLRHQAGGYLNYDLPFGNGKALLGGATGALNKVVGGWRMGTIVSFRSGFEFSPLVGSNRSGNGDTSVQPDRPNINPAFTGNLIVGTQKKWFDPNAFSLPTAGTFGNVPRGYISGPGLEAVDFSLFKTTNISERFNLEFRGECFNVLNHTNLGNPSLGIFSGTSVNPSAGLITTTSTASRQIQFGLKLLF